MSTADPRARETVYTEYDSRGTYAETELLDGKSNGPRRSQTKLN